LAAILALTATAAIVALLFGQAAQPAGQFGIDFAAYQDAAAALGRGASPYADELLSGPFAAQGAGHYLYPPLLAQLLSPLAGLATQPAATIWLVLQAAAVYAAVWLALVLGAPTRTAGHATGRAAPRLEPALWAAAATAWFLPVVDTLWKGNVSGFLALDVVLVAAGGALGGASLVLAVLLKVSPLGLAATLPGGGRRFAAGAATTAVILVAASVALAPSAWLDYVRVLPNLFTGDATQPTNLSPWAVALNLGAPAWLATGIRLAGLTCAAGCLLLCAALARRRGGWHAAVTFGTVAMLLLPAQLWYHYLVVLLPLAALAWGRAAGRRRSAMVLAAAGVSVGVAWLPLAALSASVLAVTLVAVVWPKPSAAAGAVPADAAPASPVTASGAPA
jgi:hypothetical protein